MNSRHLTFLLASLLILSSCVAFAQSGNNRVLEAAGIAAQGFPLSSPSHIQAVAALSQAYFDIGDTVRARGLLDQAYRELYFADFANSDFGRKRIEYDRAMVMMQEGKNGGLYDVIRLLRAHDPANDDNECQAKVGALMDFAYRALLIGDSSLSSELTSEAISLSSSCGPYLQRAVEHIASGLFDMGHKAHAEAIIDSLLPDLNDRRFTKIKIAALYAKGDDDGSARRILAHLPDFRTPENIDSVSFWISMLASARAVCDAYMGDSQGAIDTLSGIQQVSPRDQAAAVIAKIFARANLVESCDSAISIITDEDMRSNACIDVASIFADRWLNDTTALRFIDSSLSQVDISTSSGITLIERVDSILVDWGFVEDAGRIVNIFVELANPRLTFNLNEHEARVVRKLIAINNWEYARDSLFAIADSLLPTTRSNLVSELVDSYFDVGDLLHAYSLCADFLSRYRSATLNEVSVYRLANRLASTFEFRHLADSLSLHMNHHDQSANRVSIMCGMAEAHWYDGYGDSALVLLNDAQHLAFGLNPRREEAAIAWERIALAYAVCGEDDSALAAVDEARSVVLNWSNDQGDYLERLRRQHIPTLATVYVKAGRVDQASNLLTELTMESEKTEALLAMVMSSAHPRVQNDLFEIASAIQHNPARSEALLTVCARYLQEDSLQKAISVLDLIDFPISRIVGLSGLADWYLNHGDYRQADSIFGEVLTEHKGLGSSVEQHEALLRLNAVSTYLSRAPHLRLRLNWEDRRESCPELAAAVSVSDASWRQGRPALIRDYQKKSNELLLLPEEVLVFAEPSLNDSVLAWIARPEGSEGLLRSLRYANATKRIGTMTWFAVQFADSGDINTARYLVDRAIALTSEEDPNGILYIARIYRTTQDSVYNSMLYSRAIKLGTQYARRSDNVLSTYVKTNIAALYYCHEGFDTVTVNETPGLTPYEELSYYADVNADCICSKWYSPNQPKQITDQFLRAISRIDQPFLKWYELMGRIQQCKYYWNWKPALTIMDSLDAIITDQLQRDYISSMWAYFWITRRPGYQDFTQALNYTSRIADEMMYSWIAAVVLPEAVGHTDLQEILLLVERISDPLLRVTTLSRIGRQCTLESVGVDENAERVLERIVQNTH